MFVDKVQVVVKAGDGGNGALSFRHEKFVDHGGPDGGDGGNGGDIVMVASRNQNTLANYRHQKLLVAEAGQGGDKRRRHGKSGQDFEVMVPVGTVVMNEQGETVADLISDGQHTVVAMGGKGGFGNAHFVSSTRQAPRIAEKGELGERFELILELKMIADVGIVGLPNAGKSTLLGHISNANPAIADYPFTTLRPNLGVVDIDEQTSLLFADIPGLIEGASEGKGLGDEFLRHIERTRLLVHLIDAYNTDVAAAYKTVQAELAGYKIDLTDRPQIVALNKIDGLDPAVLKTKMAGLKKVIPKSCKLMAISAASGDGVKELLYEAKNLSLLALAQQAAQVPSDDGLPVIRLAENQDTWQITVEDELFIITGPKIERFASRTDFNNPAGVERLRDILRKMGITHDLERHGIKSGDKFKVGSHRTLEV